MNFYRTNSESELHQQVGKYMTEAERVEIAADTLAAEMGARTYKPSFFADFGGISALGYDHRPEGHALRKVEEELGISYYEPMVNIETSVKKEDSLRGLEHRQTANRWFGVRELSLSEARGLMSYAEALTMARVVKLGPTLGDLATRYRIQPAWITLYHEKKISFATLCAKSRPHLLKYSDEDKFNDALKVAVFMEEQLVEKLSAIKLFHVRKVEGPRRAVELYKKLEVLPQIPSGKLVEILGLKFENNEMSLPAFFKSGSHWYFMTSGTTEKEGLEKITEADFQLAKAHRGNN